jgi:hypothetical protein
VHGLLEVVQRVELRGEEGGDEGFVLLARHRGVEVVGAGALAVTRLPVQLGEVERVGGDDGGDGVVEIEAVAAEKVVDGVEERLGGERAGGDDEIIGIEIERRYLIAINRDVWLFLDGPCDLGGKPLAIDGEGVPRRHARRRPAAHHQRSEQRHLLLEQSDGVGDGRGAEGVRADQLRQVGALVRGGHLHRPHLVEVDAVAALRELVRAL